MPEPIIIEFPYGETNRLVIKSLQGTPYLQLMDTNGSTILTLGVADGGYIVHRNEHTIDGPTLNVHGRLGFVKTGGV